MYKALEDLMFAVGIKQDSEQWIRLVHLLDILLLDIRVANREPLEAIFSLLAHQANKEINRLLLNKGSSPE